MKKVGISVKIKPFYSTKQALVNIWRNKTNSIGSIFIMAFTFAILGIVFAVVVNVNSIVEKTHKDFDDITVYLKENVKEDYIKKTYEEIKHIVGVKNVKFVSKEEAFEKFKKEWGEDSFLLEDIDGSPLPNQFLIELKDISFTKSVVSIIKEFKGVENIKYYKDAIDKLILVSRTIGKIGFGIVVILLILCFFIISNAINIAVNSRKVEINIMKYVGAKNLFIRMPFIIEGIIIGVVSAALSALIIYFGYDYAAETLNKQFIGYVGFIEKPIPSLTVVKDFIYIALILGTGVGILGAIRSTRKHLNV